MGLFEFVGNIGKKLFGADAPREDAAAKIKAEIDAADLGIRDLRVEFKDGNCSLSGEAPSAAAMQKAVLPAGNVQGVTAVDILELKVPEPTSEEARVEDCISKSGDTLAAIAETRYGDANKYPLIFEANREVIRNPDLIFPGQKIRIPKNGEAVKISSRAVCWPGARRAGPRPIKETGEARAPRNDVSGPRSRKIHSF